MSPHALLLFLELDGVLVLSGSAKRLQVENAIRSIASGDAKWRDYQDLWNQLFEPEPAKQLKLLHDQFETLYCLTSDWTSLMARSAMLNVLQLSGLGFVASHLHARWDTRSASTVSNHATAIESWLDINPDHEHMWAALDSEHNDNGFFSTVIIAPCKTAVSCQKTVYTKLLTPPTGLIPNDYFQ